MNNECLTLAATPLMSLFLSFSQSVPLTEGNDNSIGSTKLLSLIFDSLSVSDVDVVDIQTLTIDKACVVQVLLSYAKKPLSDQEIDSLIEAAGESLCDSGCKILTHAMSVDAIQSAEPFVITLMGEHITADFTSSVVGVIHNNHSLLCSIASLNDDMVKSTPVKNNEQMPFAYELSILLSDNSYLRDLKSQLLELAGQYSIDLAIQKDCVLRKQKRLACFDMDSTLIQAEVIDELAKEAGVGQQVAEITESAMQGKLNFNESFIKRMSLLEGLDESVLEKVAERLVLSDGVEVLFATLNRLGYKTAILSGGFDYFGRFLQKKLGIDYVYANELDIVEGKVTGRVTSEIVNGDKKAALLKMIAQNENIDLEQVIAVGDGANDLPMLATAGLGVAYKAKPLVKQSAEHSINYVGLEGILYMLGLSTQQIDALTE